MTQTPPRPKKVEPKTKGGKSISYTENFGSKDTTRKKSRQVLKKSNIQNKFLQDLLNKFYNLSIRKKLLAAFIFAQLLTIGSLVAVGTVEAIKTGKKQLVNQSESELAATETNYQIKIDQMGFGFRGQSDNAAIIDAALAANNSTPLSNELKNQVRNILQNEIQARDIEYATLVGRDRKIIVNGNANRTGQTFDPNGLVSKVITDREQIKTTEIVPNQELQQESPPILASIEQKDGYLIRYTVTPVRNPVGGLVIGALVSGDIVTGKYNIVEKTLEQFDNGYVGIYKINEDGSFTLESSVKENVEVRDVELKNVKLLKEAVTNPQEIKSDRVEIGDKVYTVTAQSILNSNQEPVGVLVRGTSEEEFNKIVRNDLLFQILIAILLILVTFVLITILSNVIAKRLESLESVSQEFAKGRFTRRTDVRGGDEIGTLAKTFNVMAENISEKEDALVQEARQVIFLQEITAARTIDDDDVDAVFRKTLKKARRLLQVDRIVVYRFNPNWSGYISHEAVDRNFPEAYNQKIEDPCIPEELRTGYLNGRIVATEDVFNAGFAPEHEALMTSLNIKANLVVPILNQGQLFGLLIAHDCQKTRKWSDREKGFLNQISTRFGVILDRVSIIKVQINATRRAEQLKEITLFLASALTRQEVLELAVKEIHPAINSDRVIIYEFDPDWRGKIVAEAVVEGYPKALGARIADPCFADKYVEKYLKGRVQATPDIYQAGLTPCHLKQLEPFKVVANLVAPILVNKKLIGLLVAHQCSGARNWEQGEIELFSQLATQLGLSLERVNLVEARQRSEIEQREAKEKLQKRALELLMEVDPVNQGDLTIRAQVTEDEIGTIADAYNATIENLRKIVSQVQSAALEVTQTTNVNEADVTLLQGEIQEQVENISAALDRIEAMSRSSSMVAQSAEQAEVTLQKAQESVKQGDIAMNKTVESILQISSSVQDASNQVKKLGEASKKISNVVNLIGGFAAQTHLLALKASIEAARAGEEGQGFAVIANEVRSLASQSAEATADIEKLVSEIQTETASVVLAMEESTVQVAEGTKLVGETRQNLNEITAATEQINELVNLIATAAIEQSENSEEVSDKMSNVATVAEKTTDSVIKLSDSFQKLLEVARLLESNVSQFKV